MAYSDKVLDHYENPRNVGKLDDKDSNVGTGMVGAPACGDVMRLQIKVDGKGKDLNNVIDIGGKISKSVSVFFKNQNLKDPTSNFDWEYILIDNKKERKEIVKKVKAFIGVEEQKPKKKSES